MSNAADQAAVLERQDASADEDTYRRSSDDPDRYPPIGDYALIGDGHTAALVSRRGSIDWACFPRFDSPSVFARILDHGKGGFWQIAPPGDFESHRQYIDDTNILRTVFATDSGRAELVDFMPVAGASQEQRGTSAIVRVVRGLTGTVDLQSIFLPRFDYGREEPHWQQLDDHSVLASHNGEAMLLVSDARLALDHDAVRVSIRVGCGEEARFVAVYRQPEPFTWRHDLTEQVPRLRDETERHWRSWISRCTYDDPGGSLVRRSALTLKLLAYAPTGAIIAAPTASLPEFIGGRRNWDYRYCWLRDSGYILEALCNVGYHDEAERFLNLIIEATEGDPQNLQVLYRIDGSRDAEERTLDHLEGYRGSQPVRVGNGAAGQYQLDAWGEVIDAAYRFHTHGGQLVPRVCDYLRAVVDHVCRHWQDPDAGIWEVRSGPQQFVYSKLMCWVAVDRAIRLAGHCGFEDAVPEWSRVRDDIVEAIRTKGWSDETQSFVQAFGNTEIDAALLALALEGFIEADDPRMVSTVERIRRELGGNGLVRRYRIEVDDGVGGDEGHFLMCSFWLADVLARMGRVEEARALFEELAGYANDVGLYAEEFDPVEGMHLGNFPQGFTHVALIEAAVTIARTEQGATEDELAPLQVTAPPA